jgi:hypothetical protein
MGFSPNIRGNSSGVTRTSTNTSGGRNVETTRTRQNQNAGVSQTNQQYRPANAPKNTPGQRTVGQTGPNQRTGGNTRSNEASGNAVLFDNYESNKRTVGNANPAAQRQGQVGTANGSVSVTGPNAVFQGGAKVNVSKDGMTVEIGGKIDATALKANGELEQTFTIRKGNDRIDVKVKLGLEGKIGADGEIKLKLNLNPRNPKVEVGASGFAGAKATLSGNIDVAVNNKAVVGTEAKVSLGLGVGGELGFKGSLTGFEAKAYSAVGVGVGVELEGKVYAGNLVRSAIELAN